MPPDNGLPHVSLEVGVEDTKHEGLFSLKKLLFFRFTTWSVGGQLGACPVTTGQRTDVNTPERVQLIRQGCPLTLGIKPL